MQPVNSYCRIMKSDVQSHYLLEADVPIDANQYYYPVDRVPQFWGYLVTLGQE